MSFSFYPNYEHKCPNVSHCSHLDGAALGYLVLLANEQESSRWAMYATIDDERACNARLVAENGRLQRELEQVKLELKLERQTKFATNQQNRDSGETTTSTANAAALVPEKKKRGAPVGHPGWFRKTPTEYDWAIDVSAPVRCPHCRGPVTAVDVAWLSTFRRTSSKAVIASFCIAMKPLFAMTAASPCNSRAMARFCTVGSVRICAVKRFICET